MIDALTVTLGLDSSNFKTGQEQTRASLKATQGEAGRVAKAMQADGAKAAEFFSSIKTQALSLLGVFLGGRGLVAFVHDTNSAMLQLGNTANYTRESVTYIDAFGRAIERMGGNATSAQSTLRNFSRTMAEMRLRGGATPLRLWANDLGVNPETAQPHQILEGFMRMIGNPAVPHEKKIVAGEELGLGPILNELFRLRGLEGYRREINKSDDLGKTTPEMAARFDKLRESMSTFSEAADKLSIAILDKFAPGLTAFFDYMTKVLLKEKPGTLSTIDSVIALTGDISGDASLYWKFFTDQVRKFFKAGNEISDYYWGPEGPGLAPGLRPHGAPAPVGYDLPTGQIDPPHGPTEAAAVMERTRAFWKSKGLTDEQVAGVLAAGPGAESNFRPNARGDYVNGVATSGGLYQHHAERLTEMKGRYGPNPTEAQQNEFAHWELTEGKYKSVWNDLRRSQTAQDAARVWTYGFEKPKHAAIEAERRAKSAPLFLPSRLRRPGRENMLEPKRPGIDIPPPVAGPRVSGETSTNSMTVGTINVHTAATDPKGIAAGLERAMSDRMVTQANRGLQ